ncbi:MAG: response regulator transcription factor [Deltaproteobacteria bacterium]|nr:response regulator transcription factor [Deltaproteobacteria bacterium]
MVAQEVLFQEDKIRILLVDDCPLIRTGLNIVLSDNPRYMVMGGAADGLEAIREVEECSPDIVFMDISMPSMDGLEATRQITRNFPDTKIIILSAYADEEHAIKAFRAGAKGYILKDAHHSQILAAVEKVLDGDMFVSPNISNNLFNSFVEVIKKSAEMEPFDTLTSREKEILGLIACGGKSKEIAEKLFISLSTVKTHRANIMEKLDIHNMAELTKMAVRKGLCKD